MSSTRVSVLSKRRRKAAVIATIGVAVNAFLALTLPELHPFSSVLLYGSRPFSDSSNSRVLQLVWKPPALSDVVVASLHNFSQEQPQDESRPVMYTFFTTLTTRRGGKNSATDAKNTAAGMSDQAHARMLSVWSQAWWEAGWYPVILTMDDAHKHEEFDQLSKVMETFKMNSYNLACFYRWIAMAATERGGWMSDYDVLPLHNFTREGGWTMLPMNGALMIHDGNHVPSLVSGNASEWDRLLHRMIEYASTTKTLVHLRRSKKNVVSRTPSDMQTLVELREVDPTAFLSDATVAGVEAIMTLPSAAAASTLGSQDWNASTDYCSSLTPPTVRAIHFAHWHVLEGYLKAHPEQSMEDRPEIAKHWLDEWKATCPQEDWQQQQQIESDNMIPLSTAD